MDHFDKKDVIQAILIADNNVENFKPLSDNDSTALIPLVNVAMLDYALEALNRSGIEEVFVFASQHLQSVRDHIKKGIASLNSWSVNMKVNVIGGEGCRCFGDAMRELDSKALIRGNFVILGADTVTNADFRPIFEQHKKITKYDKGAAATLIFKEAENHLRTGNEIMIAVDVQNNRLHHHQRLRLNGKETNFEIPLEVFMNNSQVALYHNIIDPQMAIGSPSMLSLFSDNFDFETRDDFVKGILINEEILDSRIYVSLLPREQYARKVNNWLTYQIVSNDIISRWAYPLVPDMGVVGLKQQYIFLKNNIYRSPESNMAKVILRENVLTGAGSSVGSGSYLSSSVLGRNVKIGQNCRLLNAFILDDAVVEDNCVLEFCIVGAKAKVGFKSELKDGCVVGSDCVLPANTNLSGAIVTAKVTEDDQELGDIKKLGDKAFIITAADPNKATSDDENDDEDDDGDDDLPERTAAPKMMKLPVTYEESDYYSSSDEDESRPCSPMPDDTNIFLSEVIDSLSRGFQEKSNPDFLILEINSSRYAYNMSLKEVNFNVVKAIFSLPSIKECMGNVLVDINAVFKQLGPVMSNYIKSEDAMLDCLKALEDIYEENPKVREKISQIVHFLYDKDFVSEEAILAWHEELDLEQHGNLRKSLQKLIEWLQQSSEEDDDDEESD
ncbi:translation initiation factor eIF-2B subunit epsilon [Musca vetustissima]|uniref:translation initiation factor eIF-2B subunit epsilon n=1 Tax=Musca vetustissima TaxID=27455 RepID=UPI002AB6A427|nr:translation initiation factor eIF-2B subunit epsilon [Musca vetustissima]